MKITSLANNERMLSAVLIAWMLIGWQKAAVGALSRETQEYSIAGDLQGHQQQPCVAFGGKGGFLVWHHESGQQGSSGRLVIQSLTPGMMGVGLPSPLSHSPEGTQEAHPQIALLKDGGAVVAWEAGPRNGRDVKVRFLSSSGLFASTEITANEKIAGDQFQPAVAVLTRGMVVVAWTSVGQDSSGNGIYAQRFTATGAKLGGEFRVNESIKWNQGEAALAPLADGRLAAVWVSESVNGTTSQGAPNLRGNLVGRLFQSNGQPVAAEHRINHIDAVCSRPVVTSLGEGFVVAWEQLDEKVVSNQTNIFVRKFDKNGVSPAQETRWNALTTGAQTNPVLTVWEGDGLLAWECNVKATNSIEIHARMLGGGAEFRVNQKVKYHQQHPVVAGNGDGSYLVTWVNFVEPRNSILTAVQFSNSDKADVTSGAHASYEGPGAAPLILAAKVPDSKDMVGEEIQGRITKQQLAVEFSADEQSRQAALVAQAAAAAKAIGLLQQIAAETQDPNTKSTGGSVFQDQGVRRSPMTTSKASDQVSKGEGFPNTLVRQASMSGNQGMTGGDVQRVFKAGKAVLSSAAKENLSRKRAFTPKSALRGRSLSPVKKLSMNSANPYRQVPSTLPRGMQRLGGYAAQHSTRGMASRSGGNNQPSVSQSSSLRQAQGGTTARRIASTGLATLRSQITVNGRSTVTAASRLNAMRSQRMPTQAPAQQSRANIHVNASLVRGGAGYQLQWTSRSGARYQVQRSRDSNSWENDGSIKRGTGRPINSPVSVDGKYRYFRVIKSQ